MKNFQRPKLVQLLKTVALLLERSPLTGAEILCGIGSAQEGTQVLNDSQKRAFERIKEDLADLGITLEKRRGAESVMAADETEETSFETTYYSIPRKSYVFKDLNLSGEERSALRLLRRVLAEDEGFPLRPHLAQAFQKITAIQQMVPDLSPDTIDGPSQTLASPHDPQILDRLMEAATKKHPVEFEYTSFHSENTRIRQVEPYGFFTRERIWYLVGRELQVDEVRVFRLNRIGSGKKVRVHTQGSYDIPAAFNLDDYSTVPPWNFQADGQPTRVTIRFTRSEFWRIRSFCEKHGTLTEAEGGEILWTVDARSFQPLINWLLPLGGDAAPVDPPEFVRQYRRTLSEALKHYEKVPT